MTVEPVTAPEDQLTHYGYCTFADDGCITCGDHNVPARIIALAPDGALVEDQAGQQMLVLIDFVPDAALGDVLLVHAGVALNRLATP